MGLAVLVFGFATPALFDANEIRMFKKAMR
jgi:hypothetical protein